MDTVVWYILPFGAVALGAISFIMSKLEIRRFDREFPDTDTESVEATRSRHHHA